MNKTPCIGVYYSVPKFALPTLAEFGFMIDPQKCVERILLNEPSELAVPLFDLLTWMAEQEPRLKTNSEYLKALGVARSVIDYDSREVGAETNYQSESCCQNSTANN